MIRSAVLALAALALFLAACGGDDDDGRVPDDHDDDTTPAPATIQEVPSTFPRGLTNVNPLHEASVTAASVGEGLTGICITYDLLAGEGLGDDPGAVTELLLNQENITDSLEWVTTDDVPTSEASGCYNPPSPLAPGITAMRLRYTDLTGRQFEYTWQFTVTA